MVKCQGHKRRDRPGRDSNRTFWQQHQELKPDALGDDTAVIRFLH